MQVNLASRSSILPGKLAPAAIAAIPLRNSRRAQIDFINDSSRLLFSLDNSVAISTCYFPRFRFDVVDFFVFDFVFLVLDEAREDFGAP